jgi:ribosomal protein S18 acetylase RimI-like enzyme
MRAICRDLVALPAQEGASVRVDDELGVTFVRGPGQGPDVTYAAMPGWEPGDWLASLATVRERMRAEGSWPSLLLSDELDRFPDLHAQMRRQGWTPAVTETVLWVGHASIVPHLDPLMRIEAVRPRTIDAHEELERRIFGIGADQIARRRSALTSALESGRLRAWIVRLDDRPVAVARLSQGDGTAGLQGIGVDAERRGHGYGSLITTVATRAGLATGNRVVWLSVREDNVPAMRLYERLGFARAFSWTRWLATEDPRRR